MVGRLDKFIAILGKNENIGIDTSIFIYHLEDIEPYSELTEALLSNVSRGKNNAIISSVVLIELLVKPLQDKNFNIANSIEKFLDDLPNSKILPVDLEIARKSAYIRSKYNILIPDAIHIATAIAGNSSLFVTNDIRLKKIDEIEVITLEDFIE